MKKYKVTTQRYWIGDGCGTDIFSCDGGGIHEVVDETQTMKVVD